MVNPDPKIVTKLPPCDGPRFGTTLLSENESSNLSNSLDMTELIFWFCEILNDTWLLFGDTGARQYMVVSLTTSAFTSISSSLSPNLQVVPAPGVKFVPTIVTRVFPV